MRFSTASSVALLAGSVYAVAGDWQQCRYAAQISDLRTNSIKVVESTGVGIRRVQQHLVA